MQVTSINNQTNPNFKGSGIIKQTGKAPLRFRTTLHQDRALEKLCGIAYHPEASFVTNLRRNIAKQFQLFFETKLSRDIPNLNGKYIQRSYFMDGSHNINLGSDDYLIEVRTSKKR